MKIATVTALGCAVVLLTAGVLRSRAGEADQRPTNSATAIDFDSDVALILARRCLDCHSGADAKGKLDLSKKAAATRGGDRGPRSSPASPRRACSGSTSRPTRCLPSRRFPTRKRRSSRRGSPPGRNWGTDPIDPYRVTTESAGRSRLVVASAGPSPPPPAQSGAGWSRGPIDAFVLRRAPGERSLAVTRGRPPGPDPPPQLST